MLIYGPIWQLLMVYVTHATCRQVMWCIWRVKEDDMNPNELILKFEELLQALKKAKPEERSELARRFSVTITEFEKVYAYYEKYIFDEQFGGEFDNLCP